MEATSLATARRGASVLTFTGTAFWPLDPRPEEVHIDDIAHALSNLCRFTGHTLGFYSVAQHCCHVHDALGRYGADVAAWGLLHDASEAYLGDIARPTKHAVAGFGEAYREAETRLMRAIVGRFGLAAKEPPEVREADNRMLLTEARDLMPRNPDPSLKWPDGEPYDWTIQPWAPWTAKLEFELRFRMLAVDGAVRL